MIRSAASRALLALALLAGFSAAGEGAVPAPPLSGGSRPPGLPASGAPSPAKAAPYDPEAAPDTFRVVALLVQFPPDDDPSTTGNGLFGDVPDANEVVFGDVYPEILQIPRDPAYFREQLRYLAQYWRIVSYGNLEIVAAVPETVFTAPETMAYYGENEEASRRQSALFRDAVALADGTVDFGEYDGVFVYHAGCGEETDVLGDSPGDIWTAFLTRTDFADAFADSGFEESYRGIPTGDTDDRGDTLFLTEGVLLPESETQDEIGGSLLAQWILGVSAHMTGRLLGAPSLFDTDLDDGSPSQGIGNFGIMGTGLWNSGGILPPHPCAWTKVHFGWAEPLVVTGDTTIALPPAEKADSSPRMIKIPITETEYWLIENRAKDENGDGDFNFDDVNGDNVLYPFEDSYEGAEFDWSLPNEGSLEGAGLLIWHVDESVIAASGDFRERNAVNADPSWKGVDLEEADGIQDLDLRATSFDSFGSSRDGWTASTGGVFGPATTPSTISNFGAATGVTITVESEPGSLMTLSIDFDDGRPEGWPVIGPPGRKIVGPAAAVRSEPEGVFGFAYGTRDSITGAGRGHLIGLDGRPLPGWPVDLPGPPAFGPVPFAAAADGPMTIAFPLLDGRVVKFGAGGVRDTSGVWDEAVEGAAGGFLSSAGPNGPLLLLVVGGERTRVDRLDPMIGTRTILAEIDGTPAGPAANAGDWFVTTDEGGVFRVGEGGSEAAGAVGESPHPAIHVVTRATNDPDRINVLERDLAILAGSRLTFLSRLGLAEKDRIELPAAAAGPIAVGDLDRDGYAEFLVGLGDGTVRAINRTGATSLDWPLTLRGGTSGAARDRSAGSPAIADFDGDGGMDAVLLTEGGSLWIVDSGGEPWPGYPASTVGRSEFGPLAGTTLSGESTYVLVAAEGGSFDLRVFPAAGGARIEWAGYGNGAGFPSRYAGSPDDPDPGPSLLAPKETFCYPNPVRGGGLAKLRFRLTEGAMVGVSISDAAGGRVKEFPPSFFPAETAEIVWDPRDSASGVYYARLEARSASREEVVFVPIALLR